MNYNVEICCFSVQDIINAQNGGATRVELCADKFSGGTTPSYGYVKWVVSCADIKVSMMIRPRGGDFVYSDEELKVMADDIDAAADIGVDCVVFGVIDQRGFLDCEAPSRLVEQAKKHNMEITFHRAFDVIQQPEEALEQLKQMGVTRVLTSGQRATVVEGAKFIAKLIELAGDDIIIMPGGELNESNVDRMLEIGAREVHARIEKNIKTEVPWPDNGVKMGAADCDDTLISVIDEERVRILVNKVKSFIK